MQLLLTDYQLAAATRLLEAEPDTPGPSELVTRAIALASADPPDRPPRRRPTRLTRPAPDDDARGESRLDTTVPAATGRALTLDAGDVLRVQQIGGRQCVDLTAFERAAPHRPFSAARTRAEHGIQPTTGATLMTAPPEIPLLTITADSAPGHDLAFPACTPFEYEQLTGIGGHLSCHAIHAAAQRRAGLDDAAVPDPLNLWLPSAVTRAGTLRSWPASCRAGDHVELTAQTDVTVVLSACPDDLYGSSPYEPAAVRLIVRGSRRPRITRRQPTPRAAVARHAVEVTLPPPARAALTEIAAEHYPGDPPAYVARALLCRLIERHGSAAATSPHTAS